MNINRSKNDYGPLDDPINYPAFDESQHDITDL